MKKFQLNIRNGGTHLFNSVNEAYHWACKNVMNESDINWYKECGNEIPLWEIKEERVQEIVLRNSFENVVLAIWNEKAESWENFAEFH